jgi:hypothetical protein
MAKGSSEVFSPGIRTLLKKAVEAAGQSCGQPSATSIKVPRLGLRQAALASSLAQGADLQRRLSRTSADGESW